MDAARVEILKLIRLMALNKKTAVNAESYLEGPGQNASKKELTIRFIELLIQDGSAMGFDQEDDIGDIVWCMDDISDHFHLLISAGWFSEEDGMTGWLKTLGERWGRNGVNLLWIEDPKAKMYPVYAAAAEDVPAILEQAGRAGIAICDVSGMPDGGEDDEAIDWSLG